MDHERVKKEKQRFLLLTRVLLKYLALKDLPLHLKVREIIKDCADMNRRRVPGFESVTQAMRVQLKEVVSEYYWNRAEAYLDHFLKEKAKRDAQKLTQVQPMAHSDASDNGESGELAEIAELFGNCSL